ncbi:hypothetical protein LTR70_009797 [Exophiala xenobiotica]|uniref:Uncharacterized protein n=1 Tax=Lithohypha guttulata TaxID=1690604 RepID=A0ABR0JWK8_9EURO|nr:hypothetical protein LTR24_009704 [Lithohypha guttulata]KAK5310025.1 hypothetical protein LTR70_009797 [Exophiala xenobiotica]
MPGDRNKRKVAREDNLIRKDRAKYLKILVATEDNYEDNTTSDVPMEDASSVINDTRPASSLPLGFTAGRLPPSHATNNHTARLDAPYDQDPIPQAELEFVGQQAGIAPREVERQVAMTSDPEGRIYQPANGVAEPLPLVSLSNITLNTSSSAPLISSNPFINLPPSPTGTARLPASSTSAYKTAPAITPKKGRPTTNDARRKQRQNSSVGVIGYNEDTGSPVYLSASNSSPPGDIAPRQAYAEKVGDRANDEYSNRTLSRSKAGKGKDTAPSQKSTTKATKLSAVKPSTKSVKKFTTEAASAKQLPAEALASTSIRTSTPTATPPLSTKYVPPYLAKTTLPTASTSTRPKNDNYTATSKPLTPEGTAKEDEARRKEQRHERRAWREKELQNTKKTWEGHKMPRNWGLVALPEDEV